MVLTPRTWHCRNDVTNCTWDNALPNIPSQRCQSTDIICSGCHNLTNRPEVWWSSTLQCLTFPPSVCAAGRKILSSMPSAYSKSSDTSICVSGSGSSVSHLSVANSCSLGPVLALAFFGRPSVETPELKVSSNRVGYHDRQEEDGEERTWRRSSVVSYSLCSRQVRDLRCLIVLDAAFTLFRALLVFKMSIRLVVAGILQPITTSGIWLTKRPSQHTLQHRGQDITMIGCLSALKAAADD